MYYVEQVIRTFNWNKRRVRWQFYCSPHVVDYWVCNDIDTRSVAPPDHVGELVTVSGPRLKLVRDRLVTRPPGRALDMLHGGRDLKWKGGKSEKNTTFSKWIEIYLDTTEALGSEILLAFIGDSVPRPLEQVDDNLLAIAIGLTVVLWNYSFGSNV